MHARQAPARMHTGGATQVEEFALWPIERVAHTVATTTEFKTNCNLVIIDFLVRHGFITPDQVRVGGWGEQL